MSSLVDHSDRSFTVAVSGTAKRHGMNLSSPLVMVSGGPDSVALLRAVLDLGGCPSVLHVDHGLRGEESRGDARFVEGLCASLGVPCVVRTPRIASGPGLQVRARDERYRLADELRRRTGASSVAVGHNADDVAETVLMNLSRGAGLRGLAGIPPVRGEVIRPLIGCSRGEVLRYLDLLGQPYRTDSTNLVGKYARNRLRLEVMPLLEEMYPGASANIGRAAGLLAEDLKAIEAIAEEATEVRGDEVVVPLGRLPRDADVRRTLVGHAVRTAFRRLRPDCDMPGFGVVRAVAEATEKTGGSRVFHLPRGVVAVVRGGKEVALYVEDTVGADPAAGEAVPLVAGETFFRGWRVRVEEVAEFDLEDARRSEVAYLDASKEYGLRLVKEGDTVRPLGLGGKKTVLRAMMDRKVPKDARRKVPVVVDPEGRVAWVFGGETDERFAVEKGVGEMVRLEVERV